MSSTFFQPPHGSSGSRTIYTVLYEQAQSRKNGEDGAGGSPQQRNILSYSPARSTSCFISGPSDETASAPSSSPSKSDLEFSPKYCTSSYDNYDDFLDFDGTDAAQLDACTAGLGRAIDAAKYSSLGDFGTEICWEALPPIFALSPPQSRHRRERRRLGSWAAARLEGIDDVPLVSELTEEQQRIVIEYLCEHRDSHAAMYELYEVAARANL